MFLHRKALLYSGLMGLLTLPLHTSVALTETVSDPAPAEPLGLELWLSGEEPSPEIEVPEDMAEYLELDLDGNAASTSPTPEPPPQTEEVVPDIPEAPRVVVEERSSGCGVSFDGAGSAQALPCSDRSALLTALELQWQMEQGSESERSGQVPPENPLAIAVQALGASMQVSDQIEDYYFQTQRPAPLASQGDRTMLFPLQAWAPITSLFGWRLHPLEQNWRMHTGTDLGAAWGTPVVAVYSGVVEVADFVGGYGVTVVLNHPNRAQQTLYAHLSELFVQPGESIEQGEVLGRVGSTGQSTGPHLHFELREWREGWVAINADTVLEQAVMGSVTEFGASAAIAIPDQSSAISAGLSTPGYGPLHHWLALFIQSVLRYWSQINPA